MPGLALDGGAAPQWQESLLLEAAAGAGYAVPAEAAVDLGALLDALGESLRGEREAACEHMQALLLQLLTPQQAARYLLAAHPFSWNGLALAHAVASVHGGGEEAKPGGG